MLIYQIKLSKKTDAAAFIQFMQEEYIPSVHKGPTRAGEVTGLLLLQGEKKNDFFWHIGWSGIADMHPKIGDEAIKKFSARVKFIGRYEAAATRDKVQ